MTIERIIESLESQARDQNQLADGDPDSIFALDADALMEAARLLRQAYLKNGWISVKDGLPESDYCVLTYNIYSGIEIDAIGADGEWLSLGISNWMPLPEPPKDN